MNKLINEYLKIREYIINNFKLKFIIISLTYLIIISLNSFNIFYNYFLKHDKSLLIFNIIVLIYSLISASFILLLFFKLNKIIFDKYNGLIIFIITFLFLLFWIPFGMDVTDEGKQVSTAWFIFHETVHNHQYNAYKIGSWLINGLWLSIIGKPFLLWQRLGGVLLMSLMTFISFKILKMYKNDFYTFFIVIVTMLFVVCENHPETKIDHSNLPTFLAILSIYFMLLYIRSNYDFKGKIIYNILASLAMLFSVYTRFPHILFLIFPLLFYIISIKLFKLKFKNFISAALSYYLPIFIIIIGFFLFTFSINKGPNGYFQKLSIQINKLFEMNEDISEINKDVIMDTDKLRRISYNFYLFRKYTEDFVKISLLSIVFLISFFIGNKIINILKKSKYYSKNIEFILFIIAGILLFFIMRFKPWMWYVTVFGFLFAFLLTIMFKKIKLKKEFFIMFWGLLLVVISFLGSNNSFRHSIPAGAIFLFVPIIALLSKEKKELFNKENLYFMQKFTILFFIIILLISVYKKLFDNNMRDKQFFELNTMYKTRSLFGIFGSRERVEAIDGLVDFAKNEIKKDDSLICFNSVPILHYLLNVDYYFKDPWINSISHKRLKEEFEKNPLPKYIIFSKISARVKTWPDIKYDPVPLTNIKYGKNLISEKRYIEKYKFIIDYINNNKYKNIYENNVFILYRIDNR